VSYGTLRTDLLGLSDPSDGDGEGNEGETERLS